MRKKAVIEDLRIQTNGIRLEIRVDWDNDRHQAVELEGTDAESLRDGLERLKTLLSVDIINGEI